MCYGKILIVGSPVLYQALQIILYSSFIKLGCERFRLGARSHLLTEFQCKAIKHRCFIYLKKSPYTELQNITKLHVLLQKNCRLQQEECYFTKYGNLQLLFTISKDGKRVSFMAYTVQHNYTFSKIRFYFPLYLYFSTYISLRTSRQKSLIPWICQFFSGICKMFLRCPCLCLLNARIALSSSYCPAYLPHM